MRHWCTNVKLSFICKSAGACIFKFEEDARVYTMHLKAAEVAVDHEGVAVCSLGKFGIANVFPEHTYPPDHAPQTTGPDTQFLRRQTGERVESSSTSTAAAHCLL